MQKLHNIFQQPLEPKYTKEKGTYVLAIDEIVPQVPFQIVTQWIVNIPAKQFGGNHKHPRQEAWIGIGEGLELIWLDENNTVQRKLMNENGQITLLVMPSNIPHAVVNNSDQPAILYELADDHMNNVEMVDVMSMVK